MAYSWYPGDCVFCRIITGSEPAEVVMRWDDAIAFVPLNPVTEGHLLVVPRTHIPSFTWSPNVTAQVMRRAAEISPYPANLITSAGEVATQTVRHIHVHIVPRRPGDGLALPWTASEPV